MQTLNIDSSQISSFLTCPRQWYYGYSRRLTSISGPPSEAMVLGTYGHRLLDIYYKARAEGKTIPESSAMAWDFEPEQETNCLKCKGERRNLTVEGYCPLQNPEDEGHLFEPTPFPLSADGRKLVKKRFLEYTCVYVQNDIIPLSPDHVEVGFTHPLYEDKDFLFALEGRMDLLGSLYGNDIIMDHKFQMRKHDLYTKSIQFRNYALVAGLDHFVINYIRLNKESTNDTYNRTLIPFTKPEHEQWRVNLISIFKRMARMIAEAESDEHFWKKNVSEPNWAACGGSFGYPCNFTPLCNEPGLVDAKIPILYHIKEEWKPW